MLRTSLRINATLVNSLFAGGKKASGSLIMLAYKKEGLKPRFSFSVSKKVAPSSVLRHKLRRMGYAAVEKILKTQVVSPGAYAFVIKRNNNVTVDALGSEILSVLEKIGSLSKKTDIV